MLRVKDDRALIAAAREIVDVAPLRFDRDECNDNGVDVVTISEHLGKLRVEINGELFTEYLYRGFSKPILYPVVGPHGIGMTRNFPMRRVEGESNDHPHHKSLWFAHGSVNGIDFWHEQAGTGTIVHEALGRISAART